jgi:hypothetical protein
MDLDAKSGEGKQKRTLGEKGGEREGERVREGEAARRRRRRALINTPPFLFVLPGESTNTERRWWRRSLFPL